MTLVSAGPGSGKTLAVAAWAASGQAPGPVAWLSLDHTDNDASAFWSDVLAALTATSTLPADNPISELTPATTFTRHEVAKIEAGLAELDVSVTLVLDDLHELSDRSVLDGLEQVLEHPLPTLRLVLLTRSDPMLRLHRLRVGGELTELRERDLAFDAREARQLFASHGLEMSPAQVSALLARTEGWAAGLRFAAMSLDPADIDTGIEVFSGQQRPVAEYFVGEVLSRQPPAVRTFLLRTSPVDRVTGQLANALTDRADGGRMLEQLASQGAFVVELGPDRTWFRYHPLLRQLLQYQLELDHANLVKELHLRAAQWFLDHDAALDAIRHAVAAGDWKLVGQIVVSRALPAVLSASGPALAAALAPASASARTHPSVELLICAAVCSLQRHDYPSMDRDIAAARREAAGGSSSPVPTDVVLTLFEMAGARARGEITQVAAKARRVVELVDRAGPGELPVGAQYRAIAESNLGVGLLWSGRFVEAEEALVSAATQSERLDLVLPHLNARAHLALIDVIRHRLRTGHADASDVLRTAERRGWRSEPQTRAAFLVLGLVHLEWGNVDLAADYLAAAREASRGQAEDATSVAWSIIESRLLLSRGRLDEALRAVARLRTWAADHPAAALLSGSITVLSAESLLLAGNPDAAAAAIRASPSDTRAMPSARIVLGRAALALRRPQDALEHVQAIIDDPPIERGAVIEALLVQAIAAHELRQDSTATHTFSRALALAEPEGTYRPFAVHKAQALELLRREQLLAGAHAEFASTLIDRLSEQLSPEPPKPLVEPLTERELTVLRYLPTRLSYREIGDDLFVSVNTVKAHLKSLYRKLAADDRNDAIDRARRLGLL